MGAFFSIKISKLNLMMLSSGGFIPPQASHGKRRVFCYRKYIAIAVLVFNESFSYLLRSKVEVRRTGGIGFFVLVL